MKLDETLPRLRTSQAGVELIQSFEKCKLIAYVDDVGVLTIGWGHTGPEVKRGLRWTQQQADQTLEADLLQRERDVASLVKVPVQQREFDALVSFAFNVGTDIDADAIAEGLGDSTLLKLLNAGDKIGAANEFLKWNKGTVGGKRVELRGLTRRRNAERAMFLGQNWRGFL